MKVSNSSYSTHIRPSFVLNKTYNCNMYKFSMLSRDTVSFQAKSKNLVKDLYQITSDTKCFSSFIKEAIQNPRKSQETTKILLNQAGSTNNFLKWYFAKGGYKEKYVDYITQTVKEAKNPEELLKISPNWGFWVFEKQFGKDFFIGKTPKAIGTKKDYRNLVTNLLQNEDTGFKVEILPNGLSGKRAFLVDTGENKYVLKTQEDFALYSKELDSALKKDKWLQDTFMKRFKENENMKSDSSYINAMIDFYLNLNNCVNAAKIHCFDAKTSSVLYDYLSGTNQSITDINKQLPDLKKLGIIYNDIFSDNFREKDGVLKIIDSGESSFIDLLKPTVPNFQIELPNWSGNNILSTLGALLYLNLQKKNQQNKILLVEKIKFGILRRTESRLL